MADYEEFLGLHEPQLKSSCVPSHLWPALHRKLKNETLDAGEKFSMCVIGHEDLEQDQDYIQLGEDDPVYTVIVSAENGIDKDDPENIFLIDHAWSFKATEVRHHLRNIPRLLERMAKLMLCPVEQPKEEMIEYIHQNVWKYCQVYSLDSPVAIEDRMPIWYVMDEFGSAIQHSLDPSFRIVPFLYLPEQVTYSLLFPVKNLELSEEVTRNYIEGSMVTDRHMENALLLPWFFTDFTSICFEQQEPDKQYFLEGHIEETLPCLNVLSDVSGKEKNVYKVYSEYKYIHEYLDHPQFEMTDDTTEADILWYTSHFKSFENLSMSKPSAFINQFPFEHVLTVKDLLCIVCRRKLSKNVKSFDPETLESHPLWLPTTFNLKTELVQFVSYFQHRAKKGLDNHWICKPYNLARALDTHITNNIKYICRLPFSGPKIAQKYIDNPVLLEHPDGCGKVKFDIRYVILLTSVEPLKAYVYRKFFLRLANRPFDLSDLDVYEKHFTVMNYTEAPLCRLMCDDYVKSFESQYPTVKWKRVERDIFAMLLEVLECATFKSPPQGIAHNPQSRALYAADLMLSWQQDSEGVKKMQPKLLEVNWMPDCQRACEYYPQFYNDVFSLLFLDKINENVFAKLCVNSEECV